MTKSVGFQFPLAKAAEKVTFHFRNNGCTGAYCYSPGFGIQNRKNRIVELVIIIVAKPIFTMCLLIKNDLFFTLL